MQGFRAMTRLFAPHPAEAPPVGKARPPSLRSNGEKEWIALLFALLLFPFAAHADAPQDEARARALYREVRCVACQSQDIADSDAAIAADMRREIREEIAQGRTDEEIRAGLSARYGDYVLFRPRFSLGNLLLWGLPPLVLIGGLAGFFILSRGKASGRDYALSEAEQARLREILTDDSDAG
jgi:cytochrome c-type biogenesis protein CcmH